MTTELSRAVQKAALRATFQVLDRVSPERAGALGAHYWFRVPPCPPLDRRMRSFSPGEPLLAGTPGRQVRGYAWGAVGGPVTLLVHGWGGWWQQLGVYIEPLVAAGHRVVGFDALGHGESDPSPLGKGRGMVPDIADSLRLVTGEVGPVHSVVAHSAGGMATVLALAADVDADRVALIAPSASVPDVARFLQSLLGMGPRGVERMVARAEAVAGKPGSAFDVADLVEGLARDGRLPAGLLVHDREDDETYLAGSEKIAARWPGVETAWTQGLGHRRVLWDPQVVDRVLGFLTR